MLKKEWLVERKGRYVSVPFICDNVVKYATENELSSEEVESLKDLVQQNRDMADCHMSDQEFMFDMLRMADKLEAAIAKYI